MGDFPVKLVGSSEPKSPSLLNNWARPRAPVENPAFFIKPRRFKRDRPIEEIFSSLFFIVKKALR
jgi:hypothetical protein